MINELQWRFGHDTLTFDFVPWQNTSSMSMHTLMRAALPSPTWPDCTVQKIVWQYMSQKRRELRYGTSRLAKFNDKRFFHHWSDQSALQGWTLRTTRNDALRTPSGLWFFFSTGEFGNSYAFCKGECYQRRAPLRLWGHHIAQLASCQLYACNPSCQLACSLSLYRARSLFASTLKDKANS